MKSAVVYFSLDGSTRAIAGEIAKKVEADIYELTEIKKRPEGTKGFMTSGFQAFFGVKTKLENYFAEELKDCETIYVGTPIWAGKMTPAVNGFLSKVDAKGRKYVVFTVQAGPVASEPTKGALRMTKILMSKGAEDVKQLAFKGADINKSLSEEEAEKKVSQAI